jgi:hypothetical protein
MGFYRDGKYVYEPMDAGNGVCDQKDLDKQVRDRQKEKDQNNAGMEEDPDA